MHNNFKSLLHYTHCALNCGKRIILAMSCLLNSVITPVLHMIAEIPDGVMKTNLLKVITHCGCYAVA